MSMDLQDIKQNVVSPSQLTSPPKKNTKITGGFLKSY